VRIIEASVHSSAVSIIAGDATPRSLRSDDSVRRDVGDDVE